MAEGRRPIEDFERPLLVAMGVELVAMRRRLGVGQAPLADLALLTERSLSRIEHGQRRTRRSTLERLAAGLVLLADPGVQEDLEEESIVEFLVAKAGLALAPESPWRERSEQRARRRKARREAPEPAGVQQMVERRARRMADRLVERGYPWDGGGR